MMRVLNVAFALLLLLLAMFFHAQPNLVAARVLNTNKYLMLQSLDKGPIPPSGPSGCTFVPGSGGPNCPPHVKEMHVAGHLNRRHDAAYYPRLVVPFGAASNQH